MKGNHQKRNTALEYLRIVSMFWIIAHHLAVHSGFQFSSDQLTLQRVWIQFLQTGGKVGVNIFVLITSYFLADSYAVNKKKLLRLWLRLGVYSVGLTIFAFFFFDGMLGIKELLKSFFPVTFGVWWFATTYVVFYLIHPFLARFAQSLTQQEHLKLLLGGGILWSLLPTVTNKSFEISSLVWFIYLYFWGAFIRRYPEKLAPYRGYYLPAAGILWGLALVVMVLCDVLGLVTPWFSTQAMALFGLNRLAAFGIALLLFLGAIYANIAYRPFWNRVAVTTFGVYLFHDHVALRRLLWLQIFSVKQWQDSLLLLPYSLLAIVVVFVVGAIVDVMLQEVLDHLEKGVIWLKNRLFVNRI